MDTPAFLRERLTDLERRFDGPVPPHMRRHVQYPDGTETPEQIAQAIAYYQEQVHSNWLKCDVTERNLQHNQASGRPDQFKWYERQRDSAKNALAKSIRYRDAWMEAKALQIRMAAE